MDNNLKAMTENHPLVLNPVSPSEKNDNVDHGEEPKHPEIEVTEPNNEYPEEIDDHLQRPHRQRSHFLGPVYTYDPETGSTIGEAEIPDVNVYQHKKTLAQGMMDLALFSANANQLRYVLESYARHPYYYASVIFITLSLVIQVAIGIGLIWNATYNVKDRKEICLANKINNFTIIGIFLVTVVNVFISAFGVADPV
ncbi:unnamed protein product [Phaedon cochleariae]|uniref:Uncharacterized protein n=1 Tax=Phaedon cochleariae TaxID=80249 RepID=A0A9N9X5L1_PHACE|nr:unnamed protein product [Phaedon cochleariae]